MSNNKMTKFKNLYISISVELNHRLQISHYKIKSYSNNKFDEFLV